MIDINELRRLGEGQQWIGRGYDAGCETLMAERDGEHEEVAHPMPIGLVPYLVAVQPAAVSELLDRLEAAEKADAESLAMYRKARDERDALRAEIERLQSNLSASAQAFVQLEAVAAEARRNDATAMSWISEAKHAIGYEGDMPGFIGALRELNDVRRRVPAKITVSKAPHSQYAKGWNDCMKAIKEETK